MDGWMDGKQAFHRREGCVNDAKKEGVMMRRE